MPGKVSGSRDKLVSKSTYSSSPHGACSAVGERERHWSNNHAYEYLTQTDEFYEEGHLFISTK